jgi:hypothetical protein
VGKRSDFDRTPQDWYATPAKAVDPLLPHLSPGTRFIEPCAGDGALIRHLEAAGHVCVHASDIALRAPGIVQDDAATTVAHEGAAWISNPPWRWDLLAPIIENLSAQLPTWLLLDADIIHNIRMAPLMERCQRIVSIGRVQWIADTKQAGKSNAIWALFHAVPGPCLFFERQPRAKLGTPRKEP